MRPAVVTLAVLAFACSPERDPLPGRTEAAPGEAAPGAAPDGAEVSVGPDTRAFRYTSLENCRVLRRETGEMPFVEELCPGTGGYALKVSESDLRYEVAVVAPDGIETGLALSAVGGGGFSELGPRAEWRGPAGDAFTPDSLILRYRVAENAQPPSEVSYLLAVRLAPRPCVSGRIAPGAGQNARSRASADAGGPCLAD